MGKCTHVYTTVRQRPKSGQKKGRMWKSERQGKSFAFRGDFLIKVVLSERETNNIWFIGDLRPSLSSSSGSASFRLEKLSQYICFCQYFLQCINEVFIHEVLGFHNI